MLLNTKILKSYYGLLCSRVLLWSEIQEKNVGSKGVGNQVCIINLHFYKNKIKSQLFCFCTHRKSWNLINLGTMEQRGRVE